MSVNLVTPSATALNRAVRSAQLVGVKAAFSTLQPVKMRPSALFKAVAEGVTAFTDIAVVGSRRGEVNRQITSPCGVCRQALFEFGGPELNVIMAKTPEDFIERSMDELLPFGFGPSNVAGNSAVEGK